MPLRDLAAFQDRCVFGLAKSTESMKKRSMDAYILDWITMLIRWLHVVTAMAWIGASFFFIHLDASLQPEADIPPGTGGRAWQVHGGGFYEMRKYAVAPDRLPAHLTWHKWQSYWTWISGFFLLTTVYYAQSQLFLIDPAVMVLSPLQAAAIGIGGLVVGWLVYDGLCRSALRGHDGLLALAGFGFVVLASYGFTRVFSGRGALIHTGALMATIMTFNVFFVIMPNQRKTIAALSAGQAPDPAWGAQAKSRSLHNNYITLPVIFMMLANHYPVTYANPAVIPALTALVTLTGAMVRHFYNQRHKDHASSPWWAWLVAALAIWTAFFVAASASPGWRKTLGLGPLPLLPAVHYAGLKTPPVQVVNIIEGRCAMCHAAKPFWPGIDIAPYHVLLDSPRHIAIAAPAILRMAVMTHAMPPNNVSGITRAERGTLAHWLAGS